MSAHPFDVPADLDHLAPLEKGNFERLHAFYFFIEEWQRTTQDPRVQFQLHSLKSSTADLIGNLLDNTLPGVEW